MSSQPVARGRVKWTDPGATPTVSANGTNNGIVGWLETRGWRSPDRPAVLHAHDATDISRELYSTNQNGSRDSIGPALRFAMPMVINGRVYIGLKG